MGRGKWIEPTDTPKLRQVEISIERLPKDEDSSDERDDYYDRDTTRRLVYFGPTDEETVVETVLTFDTDIVTDWVNEMRRLIRRRRVSSPLVVGVAIYTGKYDTTWYYRPPPGHVIPTTAAISICVGGAHCLIYMLDSSEALYEPPESYVSNLLSEFFADPKMSFVGFGIKEAAETMKKEWGLEIKNPIEARTLAKTVMGDEKVFWWKKKGKEKVLTMEKASMEKVFAMATGLKLDEKPADIRHFNWGDSCDVDDRLTMHATVDSLVSFQVGQIWLKKLGRPI